jgi:hypothetical protein
MIDDRTRLAEVLEEISAWDLSARRQYLTDIEKAFGAASAQQLKDGLVAMWRSKNA